uniref:Atg31 n=1 Tax=Lachancea thermotolerans (strain ATCC 56472 / CBS 6340 / NRRL Y-8284) TaxID=559295 RepID=UPI000455FF5C|nr:Chain B, Atg31 [Lachancea thermotolerans CBS 6340]4P1W_E Chain E, Atg31 [Lachancea thermotolerans CBS 6340]5JHF_B Chain B, KLTH0C07942p [Lachancea thermotolerans CBS 6340]5JHF_E Chain E, KLTH0C07942p [Lachancea thermotolerans CBS 6340]
MSSEANPPVLEPFTVTVVDRNVKHQVEGEPEEEGHPDHEVQGVMFATNVKYIFEDDQELLPEQEDPAIENVVIIEADESLRVTQVELISDQFKQVGYEVRDGNEVCIDALSRFETPRQLGNLPLEKLVQLYKLQNDQLHSLFNTLHHHHHH